MRTRIVIIISLLLVLLSVAAVASDIDQARAMADRTNALVESMITCTVETAVRITENFDRLFEKAEGDSKLLETLKSNYVNVINSLGNSLAEAAFRVSAATIRRIEELGFKAICYYVPVKLGDKIFLIDPIRIIDD